MQRDDLWKTIAIKDEADRARRQLLDEMNRQVTEEARQKKEQIIDGFLRDVVVQLRTTVYEAATDIAAAMTKNDGKLHPRSVVQLRSLIDRVGELNFFGDAETTKMIAQVQGLFDRPATTRNQADIKTTLQDVALVTRQSLIDLDAAGAARSARIIGAGLGEAEHPITEEIIVAARKRLNLDDANPTEDLVLGSAKPTASRSRGAI